MSDQNPCNESIMAEKKAFSTKMDPELIKELKHLAVDEGCNVMDLLEEAVGDLLLKYGLPKKSGLRPSGTGAKKTK